MKPGMSSWVLALLSLIMLAGCSENSGPTAGVLNVTLASHGSDDGAVLLTISGGPIDSVEAVGTELYSARPNASTMRLIVTGSLTSGPIARLHIPDTREASRYVASVEQVASRSAYAQQDPAGYSVSLLP